MAEQSEPQFGLAKSLLYSSLLIFLVFGLAECSVRTWAHYYRESAQKFDPEAGTYVLVPGRHRTPRGVLVINSRGFVGAELEPPGDDLWRVVAVGDSCTFGGGDDVDTYPAMLDVRLDGREAPGRRYEVVNLGISGLDSGLALRRFRSEAPPLEPDVVTIYLGWNDLMKSDPLGQSRSSRWSGAAGLLDRLWLAKGLRKLLFFHVRPRLRPPATGPESRTGRFAGFRPDVYEENLTTLVGEVRELGARPLLVTLPTVVRPDMDVAALREARVVFPYFPSAYAVGDFLDLLAAYNRAIERVALVEQVPVVDLAARFEELPDPRPYFYDTMHTNSDGMARIAAVLEEGLAAEGLLAPSAALARDARHAD